MKVALCFIINYEHILNKEHIWREWIETNKDIINVYFYYKDLKKITSPWILEHTIPPKHIYQTSYYHVVQAYMSILSFAYSHDKDNVWFCLLTDSCCPIISPKKFRYLFYENYNKSIFHWRQPWWNVEFHKRANLHKLPKQLQLANDAWFVLKREHVNCCLHFVKNQHNLFYTICNGGLANESIFAIILRMYNELDNKNSLICSPSHAIDWSRMENTTSPHLFKHGNQTDIYFIEKTLNKNNYIIFIRKISKDFPDTILKKYIYEFSKFQDDKLVLQDPFYMKKRMRGVIRETTEFVVTLLSIFFIIVFWDLAVAFFMKFL